MRSTTALCAALSALACAVTTDAWAQGSQTGTVVTERTPTYVKTPLAAPNRALEVGVETAYTQPFGDIGNDRPIGEVVDQGIGFGLDLNYRINPRWAIGWHAFYHESMADERVRDTMNVRGGTGGIHATYHIAPYERIDPYVSLGTGYRVLMQDRDADGADMWQHGLQLGKARVGVDIRLNSSVAVGPFIGADMNMFLFENPEGEAGNREIPNKDLSSFVYAGVAGRFDLGGGRKNARETVAIAPVRTYFITETMPIPRQAEPPRADTTQSNHTQVFIDASILSACGITSPRTYFAFDSAQLEGGDRGTLDQVADCMTNGALRGRSIEVVGHTDPRGSEQYNDKLGESRAQAVAGYLSSKGVSGPKISTQSRGEADARGTEPEGWSYDRRVDIRLAQ